MLTAAPAVPVAVNVTGEPVNEPDAAVSVFVPAVVAKVHAGEVAIPSEFVVTIAGESGPAREPVTAVNVTDVPCTTLS
jgi:hypothetical protein